MLEFSNYVDGQNGKDANAIIKELLSVKANIEELEEQKSKLTEQLKELSHVGKNETAKYRWNLTVGERKSITYKAVAEKFGENVANELATVTRYDQLRDIKPIK